MSYDIHTALERLENNLKKVESARKQVEETVTASTELQCVVAGYVNTLESLSKIINCYIAAINDMKTSYAGDLESSLSGLNTTCQNIISNFNSSINVCQEELKTGITSNISKFSSENAKLERQVNQIESLRSSIKQSVDAITALSAKLDTISTSLDDSQKGQDQILAEIKTTVSGLLPAINALVESQNTTIQSVYNEIKPQFDTLFSLSNSLIEKTNASNQKIADLGKKINDVQSELETLEDITKGININRWITIIGILVIIVLFFIK